MSRIKHILKGMIPFLILDLYHDFKRWQISKQLIGEWEKKGRPIPPPHFIKQKMLLSMAERYNLDYLVETGTFRGDMVKALRKRFKEIYTIELSEKFYNEVVRSLNRFKNIHFLHGDSAEKMPEVMKKIKTPALFWLDGHYSGGETARGKLDCPIYAELSAVLANKEDHVIVIDDAKDYNGSNDYPTLQELKEFVLKLRTGYQFEVKENMILFFPTN